ncbi:MAG: D-alanyl-D-alanine carboxypeptidase [Enhydrobacter sp.]|nr:MAG: D-alanyl-D-alanine carboxypeptidase [Enhydrobacter sp.]
MTHPFARPAAGLFWFAACLFLVATTLPTAVEAQTSAVKRASTKARTTKVARPAASTWAPNPAVRAKDAYLIVDATTGRELLSDHAEELRHPASLTKLMTLYLTFAALDSGRLSLDDTLPVSVQAANAPPTKMGVGRGAVITVRDAAMGLITRSANDAAIVLAEAMAGSEDNFARLMTQRARQLGMASTVFRNASGLPSREQVTTARDMARLAHALLRDFPHYYAVFSAQSYGYRGRVLENHNRMLANYAGADGLKTGYTAASGFNLVMSAVRDDRRLIGVVMGGNTAFQRDRQMADLMDRGFAHAHALRLAGWQWPQMPARARYQAAHFVPGIAGPALARAPQPASPTQVEAVLASMRAAPASNAAPVGDGGATPSAGSWVIQVGSFADSRAAELALQRASSALPDPIRANSAISVDEVQMAHKTFHRARVTNLSQEEALEGCKRLEARKIYCAALEVTAWNTPGAR